MRIGKCAISIFSILAYIVMVFSVNVPDVSAAASAPVTLYADSGFCGVSQDFELGNHDISELNAPGGVGNDKVTAIRVTPGYIGTTTWPSYFDSDYQNAGGGAVYRWGNPGQGSVFGQPILADGPGGPEGHVTLYDWVVFR